jgi:hypothetical protein
VSLSVVQALPPVLIEQWRVYLSHGLMPTSLNVRLLIRSIYLHTRLLPAYRFGHDDGGSDAAPRHLGMPVFAVALFTSPPPLPCCLRWCSHKVRQMQERR